MNKELRSELIDLVGAGHERRDQPFQLASGEWSHDYIDGKRALSTGRGLKLAARGIVAAVLDEGVTFEAVGGLTMGADPLSHVVASETDAAWFSVRKERKRHGRQKLIEGVELRPGMRVLLLDDVVTTGLSVFQALDAIEEEDAQVVLAVTLLDRGDVAIDEFAKRNVRYRPLITYRDLGIEPVGHGRVGAVPAC